MNHKGKNENLRILVIDESIERARMVNDSLRDCGYVNVTIRTTDVPIWELVHDLKPNLILIDVESPGRDTLEQLTLIRDKQPTPVILLTRDQDLTSIRAAIDSGVTSYITAGISPDIVQPAIEVATSTFRMFESLRSELQVAKNSLSDQKYIGKAKGFLMESWGLNENQAHAYIRKSAMDNKVKMAEIAKKILQSKIV